MIKRQQLSIGLKTLLIYFILMTSITSISALGTEEITDENNQSERWDGEVGASFAEGNGTQADPYQISSGNELAYLAEVINNKTDGNKYNTSQIYYILTNNIVLNDTTDWQIWDETTSPEDAKTLNHWTPIGKSGASAAFAANFNGSGYEISGIYINLPSSSELSYQGLFGYVATGVIENLGVVDSFIRGYQYVGGIAGTIKFSSGINNSYNTGNIIGNVSVGGIVGSVSSTGTLSNSYNTGYVKGFKEAVGGIVGEAQWQVKINNCYNTGNVSANNMVGGIAGYTNSNVEINNSYNTGNLSGSKYVGGLVGQAYTGNVNNSYFYETSGLPATGSLDGVDTSFVYSFDETGKFSAEDNYNGETTLLGALNKWVSEQDSSVEEFFFFEEIDSPINLRFRKFHQEAPSTIILASRTQSSLTFEFIEGAEYRIDDNQWQNSNIFTNLTPGQSYTVYIRLKETNTHNASGTLEEIFETIPKITIESDINIDDSMLDDYIEGNILPVPNTPEGVIFNGWKDASGAIITTLEKIEDKVVLTATYSVEEPEIIINQNQVGNDQVELSVNIDNSYDNLSYTYIWYKIVSGESELIDGKTTSSITVNVYDTMAYRCEVQVKVDNLISRPFEKEITIEKINPVVSLTITLESRTQSSLTFEFIEGAEYRINDNQWQNSNIFTNLLPGQPYIIYVRLKETNTHKASDTVEDVFKTIPQISIESDINIDYNMLDDYIEGNTLPVPSTPQGVEFIGWQDANGQTITTLENVVDEVELQALFCIEEHSITISESEIIDNNVELSVEIDKTYDNLSYTYIWYKIVGGEPELIEGKTTSSITVEINETTEYRCEVKISINNLSTELEDDITIEKSVKKPTNNNGIYLISGILLILLILLTGYRVMTTKRQKKEQV